MTGECDLASPAMVALCSACMWLCVSVVWGVRFDDATDVDKFLRVSKSSDLVMVTMVCRCVVGFAASLYGCKCGAMARMAAVL
jgi:hypothetical protein